MENTGGSLSFLIMIVLMFIAFYFLIIFPENRRKKKLYQQIDSMKEGDRFITSGGIIATFVSKDPEKNIIKAKISDSTVVEIGRDFIVGVLSSDLERK